MSQSAGQEMRISVTNNAMANEPEASERRQTRSMTTSAQQVSRVHTTTVPRVEKQLDAVNNKATQSAALFMEHTKQSKQHCRKKAAAKVVPPDAPACNTGSQKRSQRPRKQLECDRLPREPVNQQRRTRSSQGS